MVSNDESRSSFELAGMAFSPRWLELSVSSWDADVDVVRAVCTHDARDGAVGAIIGFTERVRDASESARESAKVIFTVTASSEDAHGEAGRNFSGGCGGAGLGEGRKPSSLLSASSCKRSLARRSASAVPDRSSVKRPARHFWSPAENRTYAEVESTAARAAATL